MTLETHLIRRASELRRHHQGNGCCFWGASGRAFRDVDIEQGAAWVGSVCACAKCSRADARGKAGEQLRMMEAAE